MRLRGEEVYGISVSLVRPAVLDALDVYEQGSGEGSEGGQLGVRTGDVLIENVVLLDHIVYDLAALLVDDQHLPLQPS